ncbi:MAG: hypothetical protein ACI9UK_001915 [Candidatus Krumholzibacteriia bacterium]
MASGLCKRATAAQPGSLQNVNFAVPVFLPLREPTMSKRSRSILLLASAIPFGVLASDAPAPQDPVDVVSFKSDAQWLVVNDGVMGGLSESSLRLTEQESGTFSGELSLENNGGFASVRTMAIAQNLSSYSGLKIRVKGDGRKYQLRLRIDNLLDGGAYRSIFETQGGVWETIVIEFDQFQPTWRGRILDDVAKLNPDRIRQVGFLVTGEMPGPFSLEIDFVQAVPQIRTEK